jgi:hypothetical protein
MKIRWQYLVEEETDLSLLLPMLLRSNKLAAVVQALIILGLMLAISSMR